MTQREIIGAMRKSLGRIGAGGLSNMVAVEAYATCWQLLGRLEADLEIDERRATGLAGFPRPAVERIDPFSDVFAGVEIDPYLPPELIEAALYAAREVVADEMMGMDLDDLDSLDRVELDILLQPDDVDGMARRNGEKP